MTFASKALESASERFFLVKLTSRRYLYLGQLTAPNTYIYTVPENLNIQSVVINGVTISSSNYTYSNNQLQIISTLNLASVSNVVTLDHNIFLTGTKQRETSSVPGIPNALWEPLILNYPNFSQSMSNIAEGVFSLSNTSIQVASTNRWCQALIGRPEAITGQYESLSKAPVEVWVCIDNVYENRKIFDGEVSSVNYSYGTAYLEIIDTFQKLNNTASFGTVTQNTITSGSLIGNLWVVYADPENETKPIPLTIGRSSPFSIQPGYKHVDPFGGVLNLNMYHLNDGQEAIAIGPSVKSQVTQTIYHAGRVLGTGIKRITFGGMFPGSVTKVFNFNKEISGTRLITNETSPDKGKSIKVTKRIINTVIFCRLNNINNFTGEIGDYIPPQYLPTPYNTQSDGAHICAFGANIHENYNLALAVMYPLGTKFAINANDFLNSFTTSQMNLPNDAIPSMSVWVENDDSATYEFFEEDVGGIIGVNTEPRFNFTTRHLPFTIMPSDEYTIGDRSVRDIVFTVPANEQINVSSSIVKVRFSPDESVNHADALKFIVKSAGMQVNDASFSQAAIDLAANVSMTIPDKGGEFPSCLQVAQSITSSTFGLLRINQSRQVEYELIKNPSLLVVDGVRDPINMLNDRTSANVQYQDMVSSVQFENPQLKNLASIGLNGPNAVVDFPIIKQVHRVDKIKKINHVLENIQTRKNAIAGYFASPTVEYSLATASEDLASSIGDIIEINNTAVADKTQTTKGVIVSLEQSGPTTSVKVNEIRGVT